MGASHEHDHPTTLVMHINIFSSHWLVSNQKQVQGKDELPPRLVMHLHWYSPVLPMASSLAQTNTLAAGHYMDVWTKFTKT